MFPVASLPDPEIAPEIKAAFDIAYANIYKFHAAQVRAPIQVETMPGIECNRICRPIERVGLYVPGGTAVLPSTCLMLGVPSQVAKCTTVVLATPPRSDGSICPEVIYAAKMMLQNAGDAMVAIDMPAGPSEQLCIGK